MIAATLHQTNDNHTQPDAEIMTRHDVMKLHRVLPITLYFQDMSKISGSDNGDVDDERNDVTSPIIEMENQAGPSGYCRNVGTVGGQSSPSSSTSSSLDDDIYLYNYRQKHLQMRDALCGDNIGMVYSRSKSSSPNESLDDELNNLTPKQLQTFNEMREEPPGDGGELDMVTCWSKSPNKTFDDELYNLTPKHFEKPKEMRKSTIGDDGNVGIVSVLSKGSSPSPRPSSIPSRTFDAEINNHPPKHLENLNETRIAPSGVGESRSMSSSPSPTKSMDDEGHILTPKHLEKLKEMTKVPSGGGDSLTKCSSSSPNKSMYDEGDILTSKHLEKVKEMRKASFGDCGAVGTLSKKSFDNLTPKHLEKMKEITKAPSGDIGTVGSLSNSLSLSSSLDAEIYNLPPKHLDKLNEMRKAMDLLELEDETASVSVFQKEKEEKSNIHSVEMVTLEVLPQKPKKTFEFTYNETCLETIYEDNNNFLGNKSQTSDTSRSYYVPEKKRRVRKEKTRRRATTQRVESSTTEPEPIGDFSVDIIKDVDDFKGADFPGYSGDYYKGKNDLNINIPSSICDESSGTPTHRVTVTTITDSSGGSGRATRSSRSPKKLKGLRKRIKALRPTKSYTVRTFSSASSSTRAVATEPPFGSTESKQRIRSESEASLESLSDNIFSSTRVSKTVSIFSCCTTPSRSQDFSDVTSIEEASQEMSRVKKDDEIVFNPFVMSSVALPTKFVEKVDFLELCNLTKLVSSSRVGIVEEEDDFDSGDYDRTLGPNFRSYKDIALSLVDSKSSTMFGAKSRLSSDETTIGKKDVSVAMSLIPRKNQATDVSYYSVPSPSESNSDISLKCESVDKNRGCVCFCLFFPKKKRFNPFL